MTKAQLIHLLEKYPDDSIIFIVENSQYLPEAKELDTIIVDISNKTTYNPPKNAEQQETTTIYLAID